VALNSVWAMEEEALTRLLDIAGREHTVDTAALEAYRAKALAGSERTAIRDGVAIMGIEGALFPKANLMTDISGATSYDMLRLDLQAALDDSKVKAILLNIDSPGGAVKGCSELTQAIYEARGRKPIVAYVRGQMASAALMIGTAADRIIVNDMAEIGSLGCMMTLRTTDDPKGSKTYEFISSQSPNKNIDPGTDAGAKAYQDRVDAMASVFVETVARNRGVDVQTVLSGFGRGGIFIGKDAVQAGLADSLGNFEAVLADLAAAKEAGGNRNTRSKGNSMSENSGATVAETTPVDVNAAISAAVTSALAAERTRAASLNTIASAHGVAADVLAKAIGENTSVEAFALAVAAMAAEKGAATVAALKADDTPVAAVAASAGTENATGETEDSVALEIAAS
jgi:signal peptide peptidase SppA